MEEIVKEIVDSNLMIVDSGCADSLFNEGIRTLKMSNEYEQATYKEIELLRAASQKCQVSILHLIIYFCVGIFQIFSLVSCFRRCSFPFLQP